MAKRRPRVRITEVAVHAGVSPATVSRVLNEVPTVRRLHRERVLHAVEQLGYRPNRIASNLRRQQSDMIGVVVSDIENLHFTQMVRAVEDGAYQRGYRVLLCNTDETAQKQRDYLEVLAAERVVGVILAPSQPAGKEIGHLLDLGIPVVAVDRRVADPRADAVLADNAGAGRLATEHLLAAGHERIGFIGPAGIETGAERQAGYEAAMRAAGLPTCSVDGGARIEGARLATERLLDDHALTALIAATNFLTVGVLQALRARRVRVPDEMALVAFDESFWSALVEPPLTTLGQPVRGMADSAVTLLLERIAGSQREPRQVVFDFELRVRRSCGTGAQRPLRTASQARRRRP